MNIKIISSLVLVILLVGQLEGARRKKGKKDKCHMGGVEKCINDMQKLGKGKDPTSIIATSAGIDKLCKSENDAIKCVKTWAKKCGSPIHREVLDLVLDMIVNQINKFCKGGSQVRIEFLKVSPCIHKKVFSTEEYKKGCNNDFLAVVDQMNTTIQGQANSAHARMCCGYLTWDDCSTKMVKEKCGDTSVKPFKDFMGGMAGTLTQMACPKDLFPLDGAECKAVKIAAGTKSKGTLGDNAMTKYVTSFFSFMFITND